MYVCRLTDGTHVSDHTQAVGSFLLLLIRALQYVFGSTAECLYKDPAETGYVFYVKSSWEIDKPFGTILLQLC